jgi:D-lactate dehydrogenase
MKKEYAAFVKKARKFLAKDSIYVDELRRLAWGTDASFYRLVPQVIVRAKNELEVIKLLKLSRELNLPVTFRAAGTSLSGQSITDSILIIAGKHWENYTIHDQGETITMQPGLIGARVNELLRPYGRKFSPDPASIKSAMIGGIIMNNASGMNCGTHANSDKVLCSARIVFADGSVLDTGNEESRITWSQTHVEFLNQIISLRDRIRNNSQLIERIQHKYAIKNVMGLNLLPFLTYDDPFEIIAHLMVGSEGTLAFLSEVTMKTINEYPFKASGMIYFSDIKEACRAVQKLKELTVANTTHKSDLTTDQLQEPIVKSAEMLDKKSLASVNDTTGEGLTALLVETKALSQEDLNNRIESIVCVLKMFDTYTEVQFTDKEEEYAPYWAIRSGIFPSVGGMRPVGTTSLIEDVAFHVKDLPEATARLQDLIAQHGYDDACIYGHVLEGNYHFIINQSFDTSKEVERYEKLMQDVVTLVVDEYGGSLKAEHGTGRNMAPFVAKEWGDDVMEIMLAIKKIFDPKFLLNPGVIFNEDEKCHLKHFKPLPITNEKVDKCIECGFCEVNCVSCGFTMSSRQRIVIQREISRLKALSTTVDEENKKTIISRLKRLQHQYHYLGEATCAGDGLCAMSCPMGINVGDLTHDIREEKQSKRMFAYSLGEYSAHHFHAIKNGLRPILTLARWSHYLLGDTLMSTLTKGLHKGLNLPQWTPAMPKSYHFRPIQHPLVSEHKVVYFPSCINQMMGTSKGTKEKTPLPEKMVELLKKAGYDVIYPKRMDDLCCGTIWESKGMPKIADKKSEELEKALYEASEQGKYPVLCDQSPCLYRMRKVMTKVDLYEPVEFILKFLIPHLDFHPIHRPIAVHATCSMQKMHLDKALTKLACLCSTKVLVPEEVGCCAFAGDKGFTQPELNTYALRKLPAQIEKHTIEVGYSNSRTCEIGLTTNTKIPYMSIIYLVDECTTAKKENYENRKCHEQ